MHVVNDILLSLFYTIAVCIVKFMFLHHLSCFVSFGTIMVIEVYPPKSFSWLCDIR